jgi:hypothetical protein
MRKACGDAIRRRSDPIQQVHRERRYSWSRRRGQHRRAKWTCPVLQPWCTEPRRSTWSWASAPQARSTRHRAGSRPDPADPRPRAGRAMRIITAEMRRTVFSCKRSASIGLPQRYTMFRLNARSRPKTGSELAFRRNTAACVYTIEAAHNPEVAGSNPAPATHKGPGNRAFVLLCKPWRSVLLQTFLQRDVPF